jgi:hypothetical protein
MNMDSVSKVVAPVNTMQPAQWIIRLRESAEAIRLRRLAQMDIACEDETFAEWQERTYVPFQMRKEAYRDVRFAEDRDDYA